LQPGSLSFELVQVTRYTSGQQFVPHTDAAPLFHARRMGLQRLATLLVYLNDVERGGATRFHLLGLEVKPQRGAALLFFPAFANGQPDERTLHSGEPAEDEKWIVQVWVQGGVDAEASESTLLNPFIKLKEYLVDFFQINWLVRE